MRMACIGLNYGLYPGDFFPSEAGRGYQLPKLLKPLASFATNSVFSQLDHPGIKGGHEAVHTYLSIVMSNKAKKCRREILPSIQRRPSSWVRKRATHPFPLALGEGYFWTRNSVEIHPPVASFFDALFKETPESKKQRLATSYKLSSSILDVVRDDAAALKNVSVNRTPKS